MSSCTDIDLINRVQNAELVPAEALAPLLKSHIDKQTQGDQRKILVDGFPRSLDQAAIIEELVSVPG